MMRRFVSCAATLFCGWVVAQSVNAQTTATAPPQPPPGTPVLPLGDIQVVIVTDVHSWIGGHGDKEAPIDADYGDVLSFFRQLKAQLAPMGRDLFFVMNGDWIDGTGLALDGDPSYLIPILEKMPWDVLTCGNHELYDENVINYMTRPGGFLDWWGNKYLTSNIVRTASQTNFGNQYRLLKGATSTVLTFGFLYNMKDNSDAVTVLEVNNVVQAPWFRDALQTPGYDAILILAHMGHDDQLLAVILTAIRNVVGDTMPVQFITGHTHIRAFTNPDDSSSSVEAGRYLDTIGFVSFPRRDTLLAQPGTGLFQHAFLDASREQLKRTLNGPPLDTEEGAELSAFIHRVQVELGLREIVGCSPQRYYFEEPIYASDSVWGLFEQVIVPTMFEGDRIVMFATEQARYDLLPGDLTVDEIISVIPFNDTIFMIPDVPLDILLHLNDTLNNERVPWMPNLLPFTFSPASPLPPVSAEPAENQTTSVPSYNLLTNQFALSRVMSPLQTLYPSVAQAQPLPQGVVDLMLAFFREDHLCDATGRGSHRPSAHPNHHNVTIPNFGFDNLSDEDKDRVRLAFVGVAIAMIALLGSLYIWKKGSNFRVESYAKEMQILDAQREFYGESDDEEFDNELL